MFTSTDLGMYEERCIKIIQSYTCNQNLHRLPYPLSHIHIPTHCHEYIYLSTAMHTYTYTHAHTLTHPESRHSHVRPESHTLTHKYMHITKHLGAGANNHGHNHAHPESHILIHKYMHIHNQGDCSNNHHRNQHLGEQHPPYSLHPSPLSNYIYIYMYIQLTRKSRNSRRAVCLFDTIRIVLWLSLYTPPYS